MALEQVTVTEKQAGTTRQYQGRHNGKVVIFAVGGIPEDWDALEVFQDDQNGTLYCVGRKDDQVLAHRWTPNKNHHKVEKAVRGNNPLADVLPTLLGDFPEDVKRDLRPRRR